MLAEGDKKKEVELTQNLDELIKEVLSIPLEYHTTSENILLNIQEEKYKIYAFEKSYTLLSIKQKKKNKFNTNNVVIVLNHFLQATNKWNTSNIIDILLKRDVCRDNQSLYFLEAINYLAAENNYQTGFHLVRLINEVSSLVHSVKKSVKNAAKHTMSLLLNCSANKDLDPFLPIISETIKDNKNVPNAIEKLAGCVFVQSVEFKALAIIAPILEKGLKSNITEVRRKSCVIIDNMCKLIEYPREIFPLIPVLRPLIHNCVENISNPEARNIAEKALVTLNKTCSESYVFTKKTEEEMRAIIKSSFGEVGLSDKTQSIVTDCEIDRVLSIVTNMYNIQHFVYDDWLVQFTRCFETDRSEECTTLYNKLYSSEATKEDKFIDDEEGADLYKGEFSLAYGALTLLNNTYIHLKKNRFYGLLGPNNCGKTTLMRALANEQVEGFPKRDELKTVFVEHEIDEREIGEDAEGYPIYNIDLCGIDWVVDCCNEVYKMLPIVTREQVEVVMQDIGFGNFKKYPGMERAADAEMGVTTYSGGWKMKMQLCAATLMNADILMLDEPTGHLDVDNIKWIKQWLTDFNTAGGSIICTSHDSLFLDDMCTHIIDFQNRKLVMFRDKSGCVLKKFVEKFPEKKGYFELKNDVTKFCFPTPGPIDSKKSSNMILKMKNVTYQYPIRDKPTVFDISLTCSLSSRVAVIGPNGSGKSTAIKLLIGELKPSSGEVWKNTSARVAYVAQHAFQHLEKHINKTPTEYILWRFAGNDDKENVDFKADIELDPDSKKKYYLKQVELFYEIHTCTTDAQEKREIILDKFFARRLNKKLKRLEYEVCWKDNPKSLRTWVTRNILVNMGKINELNRFEEKLATEAGLMDKSLTRKEVEKHLLGFSIEAEQASHTILSSLSGGQKVKVVLAASMWLNPHLVILDEPTNYLDRDGLGALTKAIEEFKGGVVIISHNREFANAVSQEKWIMDKGRLRKEGESIANQEVVDDKKNTIINEVIKDSMGNEIKVNKVTKLTAKEKRKEIKRLHKTIKEMKKSKVSVDEIYEIEDQLEKLREEE